MIEQKKNGDSSFRVHSLKRCLVAVPLILLVIMTVALTGGFFISYREETHTRSAIMLQDTVEQVQYSIESYFDELDHVSMQFLYNSTLMDALNSAPSTDPVMRLEKQRVIESELKWKILRARSDVLSCYIIADDVYRVSQKVEHLDIDRNYSNEAWYQDALNGKSYALDFACESGNQVMCSIVRRMTNISNYKNLIGIVKINFSYAGIVDICSSVQTEYKGKMCIINDRGQVLFGTAPPDAAIKSIEYQDGASYVQGEQQRYLLNQAAIDKAGWRLLLFHPVNELEAGAYQTMENMALIALIALLLAAVTMILIINKALVPLSDVIRSMQSIRNGNQNERVPVSRKDEIGYLAVSFNEMLNRIKATNDENTRLIKEVYEAELLQRDIKMQLLSRQIEPHFIFNTMNMIAIEAQMGQTERCVQNIARLSALLRALTRDEATSTLGSEIQLIQNYLKLYQERYADRMTYSIDVDEVFNGVPFPSLSFQPLVENSIIHGCEKTSRPTHISICARQEGEDLLLNVEDNAGGIPMEMLKTIRLALAGEDNAIGIGMRNVHRRLRLAFGEPYGLTIDSRCGMTVVTMRIPLRQSVHEEESNVQSIDCG